MNDQPPAPPPPAYTSPEPLELAMESLASGRAPDETARKLLQRQTRLVEMQIQQINLRRWLVGVVVALLLLGIGAVFLAVTVFDRSLAKTTTPPGKDETRA